MKRTLYIAGGFTLAFLMPFNLQAQNTQPKDTTMNRTVVVEQEYNPDILDASKVNVLPKVEEPTVSKKGSGICHYFLPGYLYSCRPNASLCRNGSAARQQARIYTRRIWKLR